MCCTNTCKTKQKTKKGETIFFKWIVLNSLNRELQTIALVLMLSLLPSPSPPSPPPPSAECGIRESIRLFRFAGGAYYLLLLLFSHEAFVIEFIAVIKMHKFSFEICSCLHYEYSIFGKPFVLARATILPFIAFAQIIFISCSNKKDQLIFATFKINMNVKS